MALLGQRQRRGAWIGSAAESSAFDLRARARPGASSPGGPADPEKYASDGSTERYQTSIRAPKRRSTGLNHAYPGLYRDQIQDLVTHSAQCDPLAADRLSSPGFRTACPRETREPALAEVSFRPPVRYSITSARRARPSRVLARPPSQRKRALARPAARPAQATARGPRGGNIVRHAKPQ